MKRIGFGVLVLLLAWPVLRGDDKAANKNKPPTPKEQFQALVKESRQAQQDVMKAFRAAKTPDERQKAMKEEATRTGALAAKFVALAEKAPKDAAALDALSWVILQNVTGPEKAKALDLLVRDHLASEQLGKLCQPVAQGPDGKSEQVLRTILAKNPHKSVQADASLALGQCLNLRVYLAKRIKEEPQVADRVEAFAGKETAEGLKKADVAALEEAAQKAYEAFADKYSADIATERLTNILGRIGFIKEAVSEPFLRAMQKDKRRPVKAIACLTLARVLKRRAESTYEKDAKEAEKIRKESEELLARAADKYGDVKLTFTRGTVGETAEYELHELRHLSVGVPAPDMSGADQDGRKFKLSDYKGKVVLLDFWSEY